MRGANIGMCPAYPTGTKPSNDVGNLLKKIPALSKANRHKLLQSQEMCLRGQCLPALVQYSQLLGGFRVIADAEITAMTIIYEYVGQVAFLRDRSTTDSNSVMDLLYTGPPRACIFPPPTSCTCVILPVYVYLEPTHVYQHMYVCPIQTSAVSSDTSS